MQDRLYPNFREGARQSQTAKLANLKAFRTALAPNVQDSVESADQEPEMPSFVATASADSKVSSGPKPLLRFIPKRYRAPLLAATAGVAALGAAACTSGSGNNTEFPQAPTNQGEVLGGAHVTPVPDASSESGQQNQLEQHKKAPDFTLNDANGNPVSLHDFAGRLLVIEYAGPGCPPCNYESAKLKAIGDDNVDKGFSAVVVSWGSDQNLSANLPVLLDPDHKFAKDYDVVGGVPVVIFIDRDGNEVFRYQGNSQDNNDLGLLIAAFVAGKDMNSVLPTATPRPTETSTPVITKENLPSDEAVFDLGNFGLAITGWEELTNVQPYQIGVGGKQVDLKTVVVKAIVRNRTDSVLRFDQFSPNSFEPTSGISFVDSNGKDLEYLPGFAKVNSYLVEPLEYTGALNEPFVPTVNGDFARVDSLYKARVISLDAIAPGFGLPVSIVATVPLNTRDYGISIKEPGSDRRKIVMKGEGAADFKTIAPDAKIAAPGDVLRIYSPSASGYVEFGFKGIEQSQFSPSFPQDNIATFHIAHRLQANVPVYNAVMQGDLYLGDGRVLRVDFPPDAFLSPGKEEDLQGRAGGVNPENIFPLLNHVTIKNAYYLDLKGSTMVLMYGKDWIAWPAGK